MSPFGSRAASLGTAWIWDPAAFRPRFVRTMPPLPKVGSRLPAVPAAAAAAEARPTARPSTNVPVNAAGVPFFTFLVLPGFLDCQPVARSIQGATGAASRSAREAAWRAGQCAKSAASETPRGQQSALVTEHDPGPPPVHPGLPQQWSWPYSQE